MAKNDRASDPIALFHEWLSDALEGSGLRYPRACCLSTVGGDSTVDGRIVDLKEVSSGQFIFGTHLESPKAAAMELNPRVSLTFWWDALGRQVRVRGLAARVSDTVADRLFAERTVDARIVASLSRQSRPLDDPAALRRRVADAVAEGADLPRPSVWGGYAVRPERVEFLQFRESRLHERVLYRSDANGWIVSYLSP